MHEIFYILAFDAISYVVALGGIDCIYSFITCCGCRSRFEVFCSGFMQRCLQAVTECLSKAEVNRSDVHKVHMIYRLRLLTSKT